MKLVTVVGARPQFIKAAPVSHAVQDSTQFEEVFVHTGQHYDDNMSSVFFDELGISTPDYNLGIGSATHGAQTGRMLESVEVVLKEENPDVVVVYGDTNSTLAGALAATKLQVFVAHVEAGLRSFNRRMPEEVNRVLTDHASDALFAPTPEAVQNLRQEGVASSKILEVGDVMYDAVLHYAEKAEKTKSLFGEIGLERGSYILATIHRAENTDNPDRLAAIFGALMEVADDIDVVLPLHPRTENVLQKEGLFEDVDRQLCLTEPLGYLSMMLLERNSCLIATDSGGVQKEAYFHRVPCVTLRDETEWTELVDHGWNVVTSPTSNESIRASISGRIGTTGDDVDLYGDGKAASRIVDYLVGQFTPEYHLK
ncbi:non-hydrolyzing UDP-N-acetylglucosamine 2-epimerase [Salinibacter sp.]|uniref:non-hydrolyzing UDP-N-acetylglucosamine 2-epimerase n=1 Tax=Salinibacter sp. TaxID=2065818 RepID=UPI0021E83DE2|nr:UDP-N-acetylglucosamine 2-epimerase (non-hydrolyzing) [Salinibacter sp.]